MYSILLNFVHIFLCALRVLYTVSVTGYVDCPKTTHVDTQSMTLGTWTTIGIARGRCRGCRCTPRATKKFFSRHFCWNEVKMGLNLVWCTPADEIKR